MRTIVRHAVIATSAIIGFSVFAAVAAPAEAGDPSATGKPASPGLTDSSHKMADKIEQRIKDLHARLLIAPMQETQWAQFSEVMRTNARNTDQMFQTRLRALPVMTAAENMASYAQIAAEHAQEMQNLVPAFQALYSAMSDSQKKTADRVFRDDARHTRQG